MAETVHRQVTYRLLPETRSGWRWLERVLEGQRQLYNAALQERSDVWRLAGVSIAWQDQFKSLTVCRREIPEMAAMPVVIQRGTLKRVDEAFKGFFRISRPNRRSSGRSSRLTGRFVSRRYHATDFRFQAGPHSALPCPSGAIEPDLARIALYGALRRSIFEHGRPGGTGRTG